MQNSDEEAKAEEVAIKADLQKEYMGELPDIWMRVQDVFDEHNRLHVRVRFR